MNNLPSLLGYLYIFLPFTIFVLTWLNYYFALPMVIFVVLSVYITIKKHTFYLSLKQDYKKILVITVIIFCWVFLSGISKRSIFQNNDSYVRNGILEVLVNDSWPVVKQENNSLIMMIYYLGFWLPAALVGKVFGISAAYFFLYVWAALGVFITYLLISNILGEVKIWPLLLFIFFSGLDIIGVFVRGIYNPSSLQNLSFISHIEWWSGKQFSSFTTQLFWVFNQAIPAWIATLLILNQKDNKSVIFIMGSLLIQSTFGFVGLIPFSIYVSLRNVCFDKNTSFSKNFLIYCKSLLSFENIIGGGISGIISFLYLLANYSSSSFHSVSIGDSNVSFIVLAVRYCAFIALEVLVYYVILFPYQKKNPLFYLSFFVLLICPFIKVGTSEDFCMRASIPSLVVLYLMVAETIKQMKREKKRFSFVILLFIILLGSITPFFEINRTVYNTFISLKNGDDPSQGVATKDEIVSLNNFGGEIKYKYQKVLFNLK